jgi:hypothetical protein
MGDTILSANLVPESEGISGAGVIRATVRYRDTLLDETLVIKYGPSRNLEHEDIAYRRFIAPLGGIGFAHRRTWATSRNLSAVAYAFVRQQPESPAPSLVEYVRKPDLQSSDRAAVISSIFRQSCAKWFTAYRNSIRTNSRVDTGSVACRQRVHRYFIGHLWRDRSEHQAEDKLNRVLEQVKNLDRVTITSSDHIRVAFNGLTVETQEPE